MDTIRMIGYDELPEGEKEYQPNNGCGREYARYLVFEIGGETVYRSDAMEPEDARFFRDLSWIQSDLSALIAERDALREELAALRFACKDVVSNLEAPIVWTARDSEVAAAILRGALDATE